MRLNRFSFFILKTIYSSEISSDLRECPDQNLGDACDAQCRLEFVSCRESCTDSLCDTECLAIYSSCVDSCPCFHDCPAGCLECSHPLCACKDPETSNPTYRQCKQEAATAIHDCLLECEKEQLCFDSCYSTFTEKIHQCPCMTECPQGCPCENGYNCQPFFTFLCQYNAASFNFIISADGHFKENRFYGIPETTNNFLYLDLTGSAILKNSVYLFGGRQDGTKIAKLNGCELVQLQNKLVNGFNIEAHSLTAVEASDEIILCFQTASFTKCEDFDGQKSTINPFTLNTRHEYGCLATYESLPIAISGGAVTNDNFSPKVETLRLSGWRYEQDHPKPARLAGCLNVNSGVITIGGEIGNTKWNHSNQVHFFHDGNWSFAGTLKETYINAPIVFYETYFIAWNSVAPYSMERVFWNGTYAYSSETVDQRDQRCDHPIIFESLPDTCSDSCDKFCFP